MTPGVDGIIKGGSGGDGDGMPSSYSDGEMGGLELPPSTGAAFRRGGRCCGFCCDYRRAVLIVDGILWIVVAISFIYELAVEEHFIKITAPQVDDGDDATNQQAADAFADSSLLKFSIAANALHAFLFLPLSFCGALKFKWTWSIPFCAFYIIGEVLALILAPTFCQDAHADGVDAENCNPPPIGYVFQTVVILLVLYPHVVYMRQCRRGILNPETYHTQEKSCCCSA
jgi:hypothetical protein